MRNTVSGKVTIVLALALLGWGVSLGLTRSLARDDEKPARSLDLAEQLEKVFNLGTIDDPKFTLADGIDLLGTRCNFPLSVNEGAFKLDNTMDVLKTELAIPTPLTLMRGSLKRALIKMLARVPASSGATYVIRTDSVEITTMAALRKELGRGAGERFLPLTNAKFEKRPLEEVLKQLTEQADFSVVLDVHAGDKAKTLITATLKNVPLDTAVRMLAHMADLQAVLQDNLLYVTTRENAAQLEKENAAWLEKERENAARLAKEREKAAQQEKEKEAK